MASKYWYKTGVNAHWATVTGNWWDDAAHTQQSAAVPAANDAIHLLGATAPDTGPAAPITFSSMDSSGLAAALDQAVTDGLITLHSANGVNRFGNAAGAHVFSGTITAAASVTFSHNSCLYGSISNAAAVVFEGDSFQDSGTITVPAGGTLVFRGSAHMQSGSTIVGDAVFQDDAASGGDSGFGITGNPTFNDGAKCYGHVIGNPTFNGNSELASSGYVTGNPVFNGSSRSYYSDTYIDGDALYNDQSHSFGTFHLGTPTFNSTYSGYEGQCGRFGALVHCTKDTIFIGSSYSDFNSSGGGTVIRAHVDLATYKPVAVSFDLQEDIFTGVPVVQGDTMVGVLEALTMGVKHAWDGKVYYCVAGIGGTPVWTEIANIGNFTGPGERSEIDVTTRAGGGNKQVIGGLMENAFEWEMPYNPSDTALVALRDAFINNTPVGMAWMDGPVATVGSFGLWADFVVLKFQREEPIDGAMTVKITAKVTLSANAPQWKTIQAS